MSERWPRRRFLAAAGAGVAATAATALAGCSHGTPAPAPSPAGSLTVLFQGDCITDGGRTRDLPQHNATAAIGPG